MNLTAWLPWLAAIVQPLGHDAESLEHAVARSHAVLRASVLRVERERDEGGESWTIVTLKVAETLKGGQKDDLRVAIGERGGDAPFDAWAKARQEGLWFFVQNKKFEAAGDRAKLPPRRRYALEPISGGGGFVIRLGPPAAEEGRPRRPCPPPVFSMNLDLLEEPEEILRAAKQAAEFASDPDHPRHALIDLPEGVMRWSGESGDFNRLLVPIDSRLEAIARELIRSPKELLSKRAEAIAKRMAGRAERAGTDDERRRIEAARHGVVDTAASLDEGNVRLMRASAILTLGQFPSRENFELVKPYLGDDKSSVQGEAAEAAGRMGARDSGDALIKLLRSAKPSVVYSASESIATLGVTAGGHELAKLLDHKELRVRTAAIEALGRLGAVEEAPGLIRLLKHKDRELRRAAAQALGWLRSKEAVPALVKLLDDGDMYVREEAAIALGDTGAPDAIPALVRVLKDRKADERARAMAAMSLGRMGAKEAAADLVGALEDSYFATRWHAAVALCRLGVTEAADPLIKLLEDRDEWVAQGAAEGLCRLGRAEGVRIILEDRVGPKFFLLNGVKSRGVWSKLHEAALASPIRGTLSEVAAALGQAAGLEVVIEESAAAYRQEWVVVGDRGNPRTLLRALEQLQETAGTGYTEIILEEGRIRIVSRKAAEAYWREWWEKERK